MTTAAAADLTADIAELVRLYRSEGFEAADRRVRVVIITRNLDAYDTALLLRGFAAEAYGQ